MSKIELTEEHVKDLRAIHVNSPMWKDAFEQAFGYAIRAGLVRPASDDPMQREWEDVKARVAALEAKYETLATATLDPSDVDETPDPHAAAKERAKLWGVELVECGTDGMGWGKLMFATTEHFYDAIKGRPSRSQWIESDGEPISGLHGYYHTPDEAWSNFPTEPPPGYAAKDDYPADVLAACSWAKKWGLKLVQDGEFWGWKYDEYMWSIAGHWVRGGAWLTKREDCLIWHPTARPPGLPSDVVVMIGPPPGHVDPKPRTEADRLERLAEVAFHTMFEEEALAFNDQSPSRKRDWRKVALAVRKAVLTSQLEPSEEEVEAASNAPVGDFYKATLRNALRAAARVRLEKAEGEKS